MREELKGEKSTSDKEISKMRLKWFNLSVKYKFFLFMSFWIVLVIIFSMFVKIPFLLDTPWITVMLYIPLTPLLILSLSIMFRPSLTFLIIFLGLTLGEILFCGIFGCSGEFPFFLASKLVSQGGGAMISSFIRKKNEILALILGALWMFIGLFIFAYTYYVIILNWGSEYILIYSLLFGGFYLFSIPLALLLNKIYRIILKVKYLEDLIGFKNINKTHSENL
ncbi:MAG: hypothetical protein P8Y70_14885 [Candidatus Lokiarchaeota archaeon]